MDRTASTAPEERSAPLGKPVRRFSSRPLQARDLFGRRFGWFPPALALVLAALAYGTYWSVLGYTQFGPAAGAAWGQPWFTLAGIGLAPMLVLLIAHMIRVRRTVTLHRNGLHFNWSRRSGLRWEELEGVAVGRTRFVFLGRPSGERVEITLFPSTGRPIRLREPLEGLPTLAEAIKAAAYPRVLPQIRDHFRGGRWVYFGPLKINHRGLATRRNSYAWDELASVSVEQGGLVIEPQSSGRFRRRETLPSATIPNIELLLQLIEEDVPG